MTTNDVVDRLREYQEHGVFTAKHRWELVGEAADEIERLRNALGNIVKTEVLTTVDQIKDYARAVTGSPVTGGQRHD